jgi:hypothetical protein
MGLLIAAAALLAALTAFGYELIAQMTENH